MSDGMTDMIEENAYEEQRRLNLGVGKVRSDGSTASYYELPNNASELQDLISAKNMNAQIGEIFRECYRYGQASHSDEIRGIKKILFYAKAELERLQKL
jgi:Flp pilus assembly CpaF family ATPase